MAADWIGLGYSVLVAAGGVLGFMRAGSLTSLIAGLMFGLLSAVGSYRTSQNPRNVWLSLAAAGTLAVMMGIRFLSSGKFMPAGLMTLASSLMLMKIIFGTLKIRHHDA